MKQTENHDMEDVLLQLAARFREQAFCRYVKNCPEYERLLEISCAADKAYYDMELTDEQRSQIDELLDSRSEASDCELTLTYIAGILDGIMFLRDYGFLDMYVAEKSA